MEKKTQLMIGGGALVGIAGLYFAWNFYSSKKAESSKKSEPSKQSENIEMVVTEKAEPEK